ncbi:HtaA domain-containing protein [Streptomyces sp. BB1-1-1]|uniref:HtaA domain-containing protein n=1 Tax=Streptomyces sp. BB1-1-1 TaxID=3074430 RepID=UPI002877B906|nr:HtaA domain-containing protein [Streptomyces sp. BB1-1-1]WND37895.1 HtaA domain-containing protein [Streptomyces sp. BB1-1-1]
MPARLRTLVTVLCAAVLGALLPVSAAHAESRTVQGGRLDWGIKSSFQSYVTGPVAKGSYSLTGGAATVGGSAFRFHSATGAYDGDTGAFRAAFSGGVHFLGHRTGAGAHQLDLTISRPTVSISGSTGTLFVDVTSKAKGTGAVTTSRQVPFAALSVGGIDMKGGGDAVTLDNLPATLTAQGAKSFAGYYTAGTALDPVSLSADVRAAARQQEPKPSSTATEADKSPEPKRTSDGATKEGAIEDGAADWGVRRTFREYVTGDIADGKWALTAGAQDGGALFRFPGGEGTYEDGDLTAAFEGAVHFTGAHGLDLSLSAVRATVEDGKGTLYADVAGPGLTGEKVPLVTFTAEGLKPADGLVKITEAPAKLTARGAEAFGGMYRAGTEMDPVSLAVALTADAELPALPDLGTAPTTSASPQPERTTGPETSADPVASAADGGDFPALPVSLAAGALLLVAAALVAVAVRRRRAQPAASPADEG